MVVPVRQGGSTVRTNLSSETALPNKFGPATATRGCSARRRRSQEVPLVIMQNLTAVGASLGVLLAAPIAQAQTKQHFGDRGEFILSADRLVPLVGWSAVSRNLMAGEFNNAQYQSGSLTTTQTSLSLLYGTAFPQQVFYTVPRVGLDYVVA